MFPCGQAFATGWFAGANDAQYPWLYHVDHGWMYASEASGGIWLWDTRLGWVWTSEAAYPYVFEPLAGWVAYNRGSRGPREFLDLSTAQWLVDQPLENRYSYYPIPDEWKTFTWFYTVNGGRPVEGSFDGITMSLDFREYTVTFSGHDLKRSSSTKANISGVAYIEGSGWLTLGGNVQISTMESLERSAFGLFQRQVDVGMDMWLTADGQPFNITGQLTASGFGELMMAFPWQRDLFEEPIGTTFYQVIPSGNLSGSLRFEVDGYPEETTEEYFDYAYDPAPSIRMEIVARHDHYFLSSGQPFQRVVEVAVTETAPDPSTGLVEVVYGRLWLAPGIGVIRFIEDNPLTGEPLVVEYSHSFM